MTQQVPIQLQNDQPAPSVYELTQSQTLSPRAAIATFDGTGAAGPFLACLSFYAQNGTLLTRVFNPNPVAAGDVAEVSYAPFPGGLISSGGGGGSTQLDYVEITASVTVAIGGDTVQTDCIVGNPIVYDGSTRVRIEIFSPSFDIQEANLIAELWIDTTDLGRMGQADVDPPVTDAGWPATMVRYLTPPAGTHTFTVKGWTTSPTNPSLFGAGPGVGGPASYMPAYLRISTA